MPFIKNKLGRTVGVILAGEEHALKPGETKEVAPLVAIHLKRVWQSGVEQVTKDSVKKKSKK